MSNKNLKLMGLGISIMLVGIYIVFNPGLSQKIHGNEEVIVFTGFIISLIGFFRKDKG